MNKKKVVIFYGRKIGKKILQILNKNQDIEIISTISTSKIRKNKHNLKKNSCIIDNHYLNSIAAD